MVRTDTIWHQWVKQNKISITLIIMNCFYTFLTSKIQLKYTNMIYKTTWNTHWFSSQWERKLTIREIETYNSENILNVNEFFLQNIDILPYNRERILVPSHLPLVLTFKRQRLLVALQAYCINKLTKSKLWSMGNINVKINITQPKYNIHFYQKHNRFLFSI